MKQASNSKMCNERSKNERIDEDIPEKKKEKKKERINPPLGSHLAICSTGSRNNASYGERKHVEANNFQSFAT